MHSYLGILITSIHSSTILYWPVRIVVVQSDLSCHENFTSLHRFEAKWETARGSVLCRLAAQYCLGALPNSPYHMTTSSQ